MAYRFALLTPLHPLKTGIADYAEEMLPHLRRALGTECEIDIFVDHFTPTGEDVLKNHRVLDIDKFPDLYDQYDLAIYQIGNNSHHFKIYQLALQYPGVVILHDYAIHHMTAAVYLDLMQDTNAYFAEVGFNHGEAAEELARQRWAKGELGLWETNAFDYPMNRRILCHSLGAIVFSQLAKDRLESYGHHVPVHRVYLHCGGPVQKCSNEDKEAARKRLNLKLAPDETLIGVFGFIGRSKRPNSILNAVQALTAQGRRVRLIYVGEIQDTSRSLPDDIQKLGMSSHVTITGFTTSEAFLDYLRASDICISLRNPTMGETSGVLMRALSMGKPSVVTDIGTFQELPEGVALKISPGDNEEAELIQALQKLMDDPKCRKAMEKASLAYAKEHLEIASTAESLAQFLREAARFHVLQKSEMYISMRDKVVATYQETKGTDPLLLERAAKTLAEIFDTAR